MFILGFILGATLLYLLMLCRCKAAEAQATLIEEAALINSRKHSLEMHEANRKIADLENQVEGLFPRLTAGSEFDRADYWKRSDDVHLDPRYRDIQFPPPEHEA